MRVLNPTISITTVSGSGLNTPTEKQRLSDWIKKESPPICCLYKFSFKYDTNGLKVKGRKKICHINTNQNIAGMSILRPK